MKLQVPSWFIAAGFLWAADRAALAQIQLQVDNRSIYALYGLNTNAPFGADWSASANGSVVNRATGAVSTSMASQMSSISSNSMSGTGDATVTGSNYISAESVLGFGFYLPTPISYSYSASVSGSGSISFSGPGITINGTATESGQLAAGTYSVHGTCSAVAGGASSGSWQFSLQVGSPPSILVTPNPVDFGSVTVRSTQDETFSIVNQGPADSVLTGTVQQPNDTYFYLVNSPTTFSLQGGDSIDVTVRFAPGADPAIYALALQAMLTIDSNDPQNPTEQVQLDGFVNGPAPTSFAKGPTCDAYLSDAVVGQLSWTSTTGMLSDLNGVVIREILMPTDGWLAGSAGCNCVTAPAPWVLTKPATWTPGTKTWAGDARDISFCALTPLPEGDPGGGLDQHGTYPYQLPYTAASFGIEQVYQWSAPWQPNWTDLLEDTITRRIYSSAGFWHYEVSSLYAGSATATLGFSFIRSFSMSHNSQGLSASINFEGTPGSTYDVERASALAGPWTVEATFAAASPGDGSIDFVDTNAPAGTAYYRMKQR